MNPIITFQYTKEKFYIIPSLEVYVVHYKKLNSNKDWKLKIYGLYLETKWFNRKIIFGTNKIVKNRFYADFIF